MTVIIGLQHEGKVYIGADGLTTFGWEAFTDARAKVMKSGSFLIGMAGTVRFADLVFYGFDIPADTEGKYDTRYMVRTFMPALHTLVKDNGMMGKYEDKDDTAGWMLIGVNGQLYAVDGLLALHLPKAGYTSIGSGSSYALGAMAALTDMPPKERVERALTIAAQFCRACAPPFTVLDI